MATQSTLFPAIPAITAVPAVVEGWVTDPAKLSFLEYRDRLIWGAPDSHGSRACINPKLIREPFRYTVRQIENPYVLGEDLNMVSGRRLSIADAAISPAGRPR